MWPLGRAAIRRRNRLMDFQPCQRRSENTGRARAADGRARRIAGRHQWPPCPRLQCCAGGGVIAAQAHHHVDMRRADAEIERRLVELLDRRAPACRMRRAEGNLAGAAGLVDQGEEGGIAKITDMKSAARACDRQRCEIKDEPRLVGVVLEFTDRAPGTDAPAMAGVGEMPARNLDWVLCERYAFHGGPW